MRTPRPPALRSPILSIALIFLSGMASRAQVLEHKRPTELVVKQYERFVARGGLLSPAGWARTSRFCAKSDPYPGNGDIVLMSAPGIIGENRVDGDHAEVSTKWGDYYGIIDSNLRFKPEPHGSVMLAEAFSLVFLRRPGKESDSGEWKIERTPRSRAAGIPAAIDYLQRMRAQISDPVLRENAQKSIETLRHLHSTCGVPNPC